MSTIQREVSGAAHWHRVLVAVAAFILLGCRGSSSDAVVSSSQSRPAEKSRDRKENMSDALFDQVKIGSLSESSGSPHVDSESFVGIKIAMPTKVVLGQFEALPLCGTWVLPEPFVGRFANLEDSVVYLIRNVETQQVYTGHFRWHEDPAEPGEGLGAVQKVPVAEEGFGFPVVGWFNFDLARVWKVPETPGTYQVQVVLDEYQSNVHELRIVESQP